jgi:hypothetical protein
MRDYKPNWVRKEQRFETKFSKIFERLRWLRALISVDSEADYFEPPIC